MYIERSISIRNRVTRKNISSHKVWKSNSRHGGHMKSKRWEESEKRSEEERRSEKRKSEERRCKGGKEEEQSRITAFVSQCSVALGESKVGSLKRRLQSPLAQSTLRSQTIQGTPCWNTLEVEISKKCTLPWGEAHLQVKTYNTQKNTTCLQR